MRTATVRASTRPDDEQLALCRAVLGQTQDGVEHLDLDRTSPLSDEVPPRSGYQLRSVADRDRP